MILKKIRNIRRHVCKGCLNFENMTKHYRCPIPHKKDKHPCPCSMCLIKSVCQEPCELVIKYNPSKFNKYVNPCKEADYSFSYDQTTRGKDSMSLLHFYEQISHAADNIK